MTHQEPHYDEWLNICLLSYEAGPTFFQLLFSPPHKEKWFLALTCLMSNSNTLLALVMRSLCISTLCCMYSASPNLFYFLLHYILFFYLVCNKDGLPYSQHLIIVIGSHRYFFTFQCWISHYSHGQHRCRSYFGTYCAMWIKEVSYSRSFFQNANSISI